MKRIINLLILLLPVFAFAQKDSVLSGIYKWKEPATTKRNKVLSTVLLEGKVHNFEWMQITANSLIPSAERIKQIVPKNQEQLIVIKKGVLQITLDDSTFPLNAGSVAVLMPGEKVLINTTQPCVFYIVKYRSKAPKDLERGKKSGGSFVKLCDAIPYKPNNIGGGRKDYFEQPTAMQKRFEMHVTTLKEGVRSHNPHTHRAEEIILMIGGNTEMQIGDKFYKGNQGDLFYLGSNVLHAIKNIGTTPSMYFAIQFE